ncbi:MAG: ribonuclease III [Kiritimatiellae bacterium]|nr:ribonuclease III [Kiritimatiellia bacterium]
MLERLRNPYAKLEKRLGYRFRRRDLLVTALTHRSYRFENSGVKNDNQRLEFLGDAALNFVATSHLFKTFPARDEGFLTAMRSRMTSGTTLAEVARSVGLGDFLRLGKGEELSGGRNRDSTLADTLEAVIGAACLDGGIQAVEKIYRRLFKRMSEGDDTDIWAENPKGLLQELVQQKWKCGPVYRLVQREGPAHAATFTVEVLVGGKLMGIGRGPSKQAAEKEAAVRALQRLGRRIAR